ncbi:MAG: protein kinase [Chitinivibrionales bacterium]|nr:protein kinase [Chitinivibrionales bacterium]MBD3358469.1 protein kinase [Chitinivibrionales bacterium]
MSEPHNNANGSTGPEDEWEKTISVRRPSADSSPQSPANESSSDPAASPYAAAAALPGGTAGEALGSGTIVSFLGEGGMARVYKIWNKDLEVHRAVKVLLPSGKKEMTDRFLTEAKISAKFDHPNIVTIFGLGMWKGCPYIEMELLDGSPLDNLLYEKKRFPPQVCTAIGILVARALSYAHLHKFMLYGKEYTGIVHRDLKPSNMIVSPLGRLTLMDFGIARPIAGGLHTTVGNVVGTLPYLSPEQINLEDIDGRTDIYALGAILYEFLCGKRAFPDDKLTDLINKKAKGTYTRFRDIPFTVTKPLARVIERALEVRAEDRFRTAEEMEDALEHIHARLTNESPETALKNFILDKDSGPAALSTFPSVHGNVFSRRRLPIFGTGAVVLALAAVGVVFLARKPQNPPSRPSDSRPQIESESLSAKLESTPSPPPVDLPPEPPAEPEKKTIPKAVKKRPLEPTPKSTPSPVRRPAASSRRDEKLDALKERLGCADLISCAEKATAEGELDDAAYVLSKIPDDGEQKSRLTIQLATRYLERGGKEDLKVAGKLVESTPGQSKAKVNLQITLARRFLDARMVEPARTVVGATRSDDPRLALCKARIDIIDRNYEKAAIILNTAMSHPATKHDALYYYCLARDGVYAQTNSAEDRRKARQAWAKLQRQYSSSPRSARYKRAVQRLEEL